MTKLNLKSKLSLKSAIFGAMIIGGFMIGTNEVYCSKSFTLKKSKKSAIKNNKKEKNIEMTTYYNPSRNDNLLEDSDPNFVPPKLERQQGKRHLMGTVKE